MASETYTVTVTIRLAWWFKPYVTSLVIWGRTAILFGAPESLIVDMVGNAASAAVERAVRVA